MKNIKILDPIADRLPVPVEDVARIDRIRDRVVGLISNEWRCVRIMFPHISEILVQKEGAARTFVTRVDVAGATPPKILDDVARQSDAAIVAIAH